MTESDYRKCKVCGELKKRILVGKFDDINKKYHDEKGGTWNGSLCPQCNRERAKNNMKLLRSGNR